MKRAMWLLLAVVVLASGCGRNRELDNLKLANTQLQKQLADAKADAEAKVADAKAKAKADAEAKKVADAKAKAKAKAVAEVKKAAVMPTSNLSQDTSTNNLVCSEEINSLVAAGKKVADVENLWLDAGGWLIGQYEPAVERAKKDLDIAGNIYNVSLDKARECMRLVIVNSMSPVTPSAISLGKQLYGAPKIAYEFGTWGNKKGIEGTGQKGKVFKPTQ